MSNRTSQPSLCQAIIGRVIVVCFALVITPPTCQAQLFYDFIEGDTGEVMATLELATLPATFVDVAGLTFPAGGELFDRFGPTYLGAFNAFEGGDVTEILPNNLGCSACSDGIAQFIDISPLGSPDGFFSLVFSNKLGDDRLHYILPNFFLVNGDWLKVVPEPTTVSYLIAAILFGVGSPRRRKRPS